MNQKFLCDFYRMTGKKYKRNIKSYLNIMFQHNVRYMYWWRKRNKKFIGKNINIYKGAIIGKENRGKKLGAPQIGNNVYIGVNSTVVGK